MDESALRRVIAGLEASRSSFNWWLEFFTLLVVIGVVVEFVFVIWEYQEDLRDFRRGIVLPPDKPSVWLLVFGVFGASLVAIGVAGEFYEESKIEVVETKIRQANDELYLLLSKEAGIAAISAKTAQSAATAIGEQEQALEAAYRRLLWEGPRDVQIGDAGKKFETLKRFRGQKYRFSICWSDLNLSEGPRDLGLTEVGRTQNAIFMQLHKVGWTAVGDVGPVPQFPHIVRNCASIGVSVDPPEQAEKATRDAAIALQEILNDILLDDMKLGFAKNLVPDPGPGILVIHVGAHKPKPSPASTPISGRK
jgi:hypothetical protein